MARRPVSEEQRKLRSAQRRLAREMREIREGKREYQRGEAGRAYIREVRRMRAPVASQREMNVISQEGQNVGLTTVYGLNKSERHEVWRHYAIINAYLNHGGVYQPENRYTRTYYTKKRLENMIRSYEGKMTGGINPVEFASDPEAILGLALAEDLTFETMYPHVTAAAA